MAVNTEARPVEREYEVSCNRSCAQVSRVILPETVRPTRLRCPLCGRPGVVETVREVGRGRRSW